MKYVFLLSALSASVLSAAEPLKPVFSETFEVAAELRPEWKVFGPRENFKIEEGVLKGHCLPGDLHGPALIIPAPAEGGLNVAFRVRMTKPGYFLFMIDGPAPGGGGDTHLLRLALHQNRISLEEDRGTMASKKEQKAAKEKALKEGQPVPKATNEQKADPNFFRTETIVRTPLEKGAFDDGQWYQIKLRVVENDITATVNNELVVTGKGTMQNQRKTQVVFLIGQEGAIEVDDVKIEEIPKS